VTVSSSSFTKNVIKTLCPDYSESTNAKLPSTNVIAK